MRNRDFTKKPRWTQTVAKGKQCMLITGYQPCYSCHQVRVKRRFQQYFNYIMEVSFIGGGNRSTQRKLSTCRKSLSIFFTYCCIEYTSPRAGFELTTLVARQTNNWLFPFCYHVQFCPSWKVNIYKYQIS